MGLVADYAIEDYFRSFQNWKNVKLWSYDFHFAFSMFFPLVAFLSLYRLFSSLFSIFLCHYGCCYKLDVQEGFKPKIPTGDTY
jgi:peptidoglycan/LPS O-acetylase OafA/YrhL